ncbi:biotin--[acetyl-CoA-carboxylase] ligase [Algoriphagus persicinus]|uniref:biotin--[acetyl-CoA-carboxylase] ligase n=1 Tax=Algoriphagus persicinus TaxID=3108754 RepID=UPI002B3AFDD4|nr:biotin--[acetyl-CoA-carboxylase] ligase [Algoriphagus sp. E1-3-M2]MEB2786187.1 biotin--[acetyl-CoA-carboxylase] ligase [Algoriphagus sp. E1-3-M2]
MYKILANTIFLGKDVHFLPECHSTNDIALNLVRHNQAAEGSIIICQNQTQGKGQRGNVWQSAAGQNLTFSLVLRPDFMDISEQFYLNMAVSNSIRRLLQEYVPHLEVKWPNDLIVPEFGKIGGILIENTFSGKEWEYAIVGIGLNINQRGFDSPNAASIRSIAGSQFNLEEMFRLLITQLEQGYIQLKKGKWKEIKGEYLMHLYRMESWANYLSNGEQFSGKIVGITADGKLEVESENGEIAVFGLKEISFI